MGTKLKYMTGEEFITKILEGERDFSGIKLDPGPYLSDHQGFEEMQEYLKQQNLEEDPVILSNSEFDSVRAVGLHLPFVKGGNINLQDANLSGANLTGAYFKDADLRRAYLLKTNLMYAHLGHANLECAHLNDADLTGAFLMNTYLKNAHFKNAHLEHVDLRHADFENANLQSADLESACIMYASFMSTNLKGVKNLEKSIGLGYAIFIETLVTPTEKEIIRNALLERKVFVVEDDPTNLFPINHLTS